MVVLVEEKDLFPFRYGFFILSKKNKSKTKSTHPIQISISHMICLSCYFFIRPIATQIANIIVIASTIVAKKRQKLSPFSSIVSLSLPRKKRSNKKSSNPIIYYPISSTMMLIILKNNMILKYEKSR